MGQSSGRIKSEGGSSSKTLSKRPSVPTDVNGEGGMGQNVKPTEEGVESWVSKRIAPSCVTMPCCCQYDVLARLDCVYRLPH